LIGEEIRRLVEAGRQDSSARFDILLTRPIAEHLEETRSTRLLTGSPSLWGMKNRAIAIPVAPGPRRA
jgi:hypothetical protein